MLKGKIFLFALLLPLLCIGQSQMLKASLQQGSAGGGGTELLTTSEAVAAENEANAVGTWSNGFNHSVQSTGSQVGSYHYRRESGNLAFANSYKEWTVVVGDVIDFTGWVRSNDDTEQNLSVSGLGSITVDTGMEPTGTTWQQFHYEGTATSTTIRFTVTASAGTASTDWIDVDDLSVINEGQ